MNANLEALEALKIDRSFLLIVLEDLKSSLPAPVTLTRNVHYEIEQTEEKLFWTNVRIAKLENKITMTQKFPFWNNRRQK